MYDNIGTVRGLLDASGTVTDTYELDTFGRSVSSSGTTPNPYRFGGAWGYITDPCGMLQLGVRYYWPELGRFLQVDPLPTGSSLYVYAMNLPVGLTDPSGKIAPALAGCIIGGGLSIIGSFMHGDSFGEGACKAGLNCALGAILGQAAVIAPFVAGCLSGLAGSAGQFAVDQVCSKCPSKNSACLGFDLVVGTLGGCAIGHAANNGHLHSVLTELASWAFGQGAHEGCMAFQ